MSAAVTLAAPPPLRVLDADGTVHFSSLKKIAKSGQQYLQTVNTPFAPTTPMLIGTASHMLILGQRPGAPPVLRYEGKARKGDAWADFEEANPDADILTAPEWAKAEQIAASVKSDRAALARLTGARFETSLTWEENGMRCSTSGVDILTSDDALGDLKTTNTADPEAWMRQAFKLHYPQQLAWYRRGARANGIACSGGLFLLGVETSPPFEVVDLDLTEGMIAFADSCVSLWLERLRVLIASCPEPATVKDWPGYSQSRVPFDVPTWMREEEGDDDASE